MVKGRYFEGLLIRRVVLRRVVTSKGCTSEGRYFRRDHYYIHDLLARYIISKKYIQTCTLPLNKKIYLWDRKYFLGTACIASLTYVCTLIYLHVCFVRYNSSKLTSKMCPNWTEIEPLSKNHGPFILVS